VLLKALDMHAAYGSSQVLFGVSLQVGAGEVVALLGRNGVGKTTCLRCLMGLTPVQRGTVQWLGESITDLPPHKIAQRGIGLVPEERRIFADLSVWENLDMGRTLHTKPDWENEIYTLFPELQKLAQRRGGTLSGGQQQMLSIARSLVGNPRLLLLDEPSEGLAPRMVEHLGDQIARLKENGLALILAEQHLNFALDLSDRVYILEKGIVQYEGTSADLRHDEAAQHQFLAL
jgi:branched-chain amino acid transport system ATP-binding protein